MDRSMRCRVVLTVLILLACIGSTAFAQPTTNEPEARADLRSESASPAQTAASSPCGAKRVGLLGSNFGGAITGVLTAAGHTVSNESAASITGGALASLDALYVIRDGAGAAASVAATIESWVRAGGTLVTEFGATGQLFDGVTYGFFPVATLDNAFAVPSGNVCGGNTVTVTSASNGSVLGLPASWPCSGDPIGVFWVYDEATLPSDLDIAARIGTDSNGDGALDAVVGTACADKGAVVAFFTDFSDFQPLEDPRVCPASCSRTVEDEQLLLNAVCVNASNCGGNLPPDCSNAAPSLGLLWPPNHNFVPISIEGVTDPEGDPVTITITGVTQDEPVNTRGDGNTCPDAEFSGSDVSVRAERTGTPSVPGNGRVYVISFTATDDNGGSCDGSVSVCVPHDKAQFSCVDDGQNFNSVGPCPAQLKGSVQTEGGPVADLSVRVLGREGKVSRLEYALPAETDVQFAVFDLAGRLVATLADGRHGAGVHQLSWDATGMARGMYFYRLRAGAKTVSGSLLVK